MVQLYILSENLHFALLYFLTGTTDYLPKNVFDIAGAGGIIYLHNSNLAYAESI